MKRLWEAIAMSRHQPTNICSLPSLYLVDITAHPSGSPRSRFPTPHGTRQGSCTWTRFGFENLICYERPEVAAPTVRVMTCVGNRLPDNSYRAGGSGGRSFERRAGRAEGHNWQRRHTVSSTPRRNVRSQSCNPATAGTPGKSSGHATPKHQNSQGSTGSVQQQAATPPKR